MSLSLSMIITKYIVNTTLQATWDGPAFLYIYCTLALTLPFHKVLVTNRNFLFAKSVPFATLITRERTVRWKEGKA